MTVMEVVDLIAAMESKFGVTAAAAVAVAQTAAVADAPAEVQTEFACMKDGLVGPLVLGFSLEDPGAVARVAAEYAKKNDKFQVRLIAFGGKLLPPEDLAVLASMPTYDQAISQLIAIMQAPIAKLVRTINEVPSKLVRTLAAIREDKEQKSG
jgi:large subunit ribosomal protein L10